MGISTDENFLGFEIRIENCPLFLTACPSKRYLKEFGWFNVRNFPAATVKGSVRSKAGQKFDILHVLGQQDNNKFKFTDYIYMD